MSAGVRPQVRDRQGKYDFDGGMDRVCVCGHTLGIHAAEAPHPCYLTTFPEGAREREREAQNDVDCECMRFRQTRKRSA